MFKAARTIARRVWQGLGAALAVAVAFPLAAQDRLPEEVSSAVRAGVVQVIATSSHIPRRSASGFRWARPDLVVTAYHVVAGADTVAIQSTANEIATSLATPVAFDVDGDLALLQLASPLPGTAMQHNSAAPPTGSPLWVVGYPLDIAGLRSRRIRLSEIAPDTLGEALNETARIDLKALQFPALDLAVLHVEGDLLPGDSGAPIVDVQGRVVGIGSGGLKSGTVGLGWGIPASRLDSLQGRGIAEKRSDPAMLQRIQTSFFSPLARERIDETLWVITDQLGTLEAYRDYLERFSNGAYAPAARTRLYALEQRYASAIDYFNRAMDYQNRMGIGGHVETVREMHERIEYNLKRAVNVYPRFEAAHLKLGYTKYMMASLLENEDEQEQAYKAAIDYLHNAIDLNPEMAEAYLFRGFAYSSISDHRYACEDYVTFIRLKNTLSPGSYDRFRQNHRFTRRFLEYHGCDVPPELEFDDPTTATDPNDPNNVQRDCRPAWWMGEAEFCAARGHAESMARIADRISLHGGSIKVLSEQETREVEDAVRYATILAENGDPRGFYHLGSMYRNGFGKPYVPELAFAYLRRAADGGFPGAFGSLGLMYRRGIVGTPDYDAARRTWARGAVLGDSYSSSNLEDFELSASLQRQRSRMFEDFKALLQRGSCTGYSFRETGSQAERFEAACAKWGPDALTQDAIVGMADVPGREEEAARFLLSVYPNVQDYNQKRVVYVLRTLREVPRQGIALLRDIVFANQFPEDPDTINLENTARMRSAALEALAAAGSRARMVADDIAKLLTSPDRHTRLMALGVIGEIGDPALAYRIQPLLSDTSLMVRLEAQRYINALSRN